MNGAHCPRSSSAGPPLQQRRCAQESRLQDETPTSFAPGQLRTLQRRVKEWRTAIACRLVLGAGDEGDVLAVVANAEPVA